MSDIVKLQARSKELAQKLVDIRGEMHDLTHSPKKGKGIELRLERMSAAFDKAESELESN